MRDSLDNKDNPGLITKKFCSHVKSNSKSSRLPEIMHLDDTLRNKPSEKVFYIDLECINIFLILSLTIIKRFELKIVRKALHILFHFF